MVQNAAIVPLTGGNTTVPDIPLDGGNMDIVSDINNAILNEASAEAEPPTLDYDNPISQKLNAIHVLLKVCVPTKPASLAHQCVDTMSWSPQMKYSCKLEMPKTLHTARCVAEIQ